MTFKIGDFGITLGEDYSYFDRSGTPLYMAPEYDNLSERKTTKIDIYALGVLALQLADGAPTIETVRHGASVKNVLKINNRTNISPGMRKLIENMVAYNPKERWSAERILEEIMNE
jgi:serine/threonine protein kinase